MISFETCYNMIILLQTYIHFNLFIETFQLLISLFFLLFAIHHAEMQNLIFTYSKQLHLCLVLYLSNAAWRIQYFEKFHTITFLCFSFSRIFVKFHFLKFHTNLLGSKAKKKRTHSVGYSRNTKQGITY